MPLPAPQFRSCFESRVGNELLRLMREDSSLSEYAAEIREARPLDFRFEGSILGPSFWLTFEGSQHDFVSGYVNSQVSFGIWHIQRLVSTKGLRAPVTGSISIDAGSASASGQGTEFVTEIEPGSVLWVGDMAAQVESVESPVALTLSEPFPEQVAGAATLDGHGTDQWLLLRISSHIRGLIWGENCGALRDSRGALADAATEFENFTAGRVRTGRKGEGNFLVSVLKVKFEAEVDSIFSEDS